SRPSRSPRRARGPRASQTGGGASGRARAWRGTTSARLPARSSARTRGSPSPEHPVEEVEVLARDAGPAIAGLYVEPPPLAELLPERLLHEEGVQARGEVGSAAVVEQAAGGALDGAAEDRRATVGEDGRPLGPGFQQHEGEALVGRRHDEGQRPGQRVPLLRLGTEAEGNQGGV